MIQIVQCWDDGVLDDIRLTELLREKNAKASFNLNMGLHDDQRSQPWRYQDGKDVIRLARSELTGVYDGFTIANHSLTHPWPTRIPIADWEREVIENRRQLQDLFQQPILGFAYPFGDHDAATRDIVRATGHVYARTCVNATPCVPPATPMATPTDCHFAAPHFWSRYEKAKAAGSSVFYFWGHSYEMLTEADWQAFAHKLDRFNADPDAIWAHLPDVIPPTQNNF